MKIIEEDLKWWKAKYKESNSPGNGLKANYHSGICRGLELALGRIKEAKESNNADVCACGPSGMVVVQSVHSPKCCICKKPVNAQR